MKIKATSSNHCRPVRKANMKNSDGVKPGEAVTHSGIGGGNGNHFGRSRRGLQYFLSSTYNFHANQQLKISAVISET